MNRRLAQSWGRTVLACAIGIMGMMLAGCEGEKKSQLNSPDYGAHLEKERFCSEAWKKFEPLSAMHDVPHNELRKINRNLVGFPSLSHGVSFYSVFLDIDADGKKEFVALEPVNQVKSYKQNNFVLILFSGSSSYKFDEFYSNLVEGNFDPKIDVINFEGVIHSFENENGTNTNLSLNQTNISLGTIDDSLYIKVTGQDGSIASNTANEVAILGNFQKSTSFSIHCSLNE